MNKSGHFFIRSILIVLVLLIIDACVKEEKAPEPPRQNIIIGTIGLNALEEIEAYHPIVNYLNSLKTLADYNFKVVAFSSLEEMKESLKNGETDIYIDSPFPIMKIREETKIEIVLNRLKNGVRDYHSVIFVRKESGIDSITDLNGKVVAFEDHSSSSSYFLPRASLSIDGIKFMEFSGVDTIPEERVGFRFSNDDANTALWVYSGKVDAGATNNIAYSQFPPKYRENFKIIYRTRAVPRHLVACRSDLDSSLKKILKRELLRMHTVEEGEKCLHEFDNTLQFIEVNREDSVIELINHYLEHIDERE